MNYQIYPSETKQWKYCHRVLRGIQAMFRLPYDYTINIELKIVPYFQRTFCLHIQRRSLFIHSIFKVLNSENFINNKLLSYFRLQVNFHTFLLQYIHCCSEKSLAVNKHMFGLCSDCSVELFFISGIYDGCIDLHTYWILWKTSEFTTVDKSISLIFDWIKDFQYSFTSLKSQ